MISGSSSGRFYDGKQAVAHDVTVQLTAAGVLARFTDSTRQRLWPYSQIRIAEKPEFGRQFAITFSSEPEARLLIMDGKFYAPLKAKLPKGSAPRVGVSASHRSLLAWTLPAVAGIALILLGLPLIAEPIAARFPKTWEKALGEYVVKGITHDMPACKEPAGAKALARLYAPLEKAAGIPVSVQVVKEESVNAFAAPGGYIVIFSGLIEKAENADEVAGVLAHELGHVIHRHPTRALVRDVGTMVVLSVVFSSLGDAANAIYLGQRLMQLSYSRDAEREADREALKLLARTRTSADGLLAFFKRLEKKEGSMGSLIGYGSSHTATADRMALIAQEKKPGGHVPLSPKEWEALKKICQ